MEPCFFSGDEVLVDGEYYDDREIERDDVVIYDFKAQERRLIKSVEVVPGDVFALLESSDYLYVNDQIVVDCSGAAIRFSRKDKEMIRLYQDSFGGVMPDNLYFFCNK